MNNTNQRWQPYTENQLKDCYKIIIDSNHDCRIVKFERDGTYTSAYSPQELPTVFEIQSYFNPNHFETNEPIVCQPLATLLQSRYLYVHIAEDHIDLCHQYAHTVVRAGKAPLLSDVLKVLEHLIISELAPDYKLEFEDHG
jgi:hypothetical protein